MPAWKVLVIGFLALLCFSLAVGTFLVPMSMDSKDKWGWTAGLGVGTLVMAVLFILFLRAADRAMDAKPSGRR